MLEINMIHSPDYDSDGVLSSESENDFDVSEATGEPVIAQQ